MSHTSPKLLRVCSPLDSVSIKNQHPARPYTPRLTYYPSTIQTPTASAADTAAPGVHNGPPLAPEMMLPVPIDALGKGASSDESDSAALANVANPTDGGLYLNTEYTFFYEKANHTNAVQRP